MNPSLYEIAEALYVLNQRIKQLRVQKMIQQDLASFDKARWKSTTHQKVCEQFNSRIRGLYRLKTAAFRKLRREYNIRPLGYHMGADGTKCDFYKLGTRCFHLEECTTTKFLGVLDGIHTDKFVSLIAQKAHDTQVVVPKNSYKHMNAEGEQIETELMKPSGKKVTFSQAFKMLKRFSGMRDLQF